MLEVYIANFQLKLTCLQLGFKSILPAFVCYEICMNSECCFLGNMSLFTHSLKTAKTALKRQRILPFFIII